jgi:hypothetical protein
MILRIDDVLASKTNSNQRGTGAGMMGGYE